MKDDAIVPFCFDCFHIANNNIFIKFVKVVFAQLGREIDLNFNVTRVTKVGIFLFYLNMVSIWNFLCCFVIKDQYLYMTEK